jgi:hypothetical protein
VCVCVYIYIFFFSLPGTTTSATSLGTPPTLFVSQSLTKWAQLPAVSAADALRCRGLTGAFVGDLGYEYRFREAGLPWEAPRARRVDSDGEEIEDSEDEEEDSEAEAEAEGGER